MNIRLKKTVIFLSLCYLSFFTINSFSNPVCSKTGAITICGEGTLDGLHVAGKATLEGTTILGNTHISGMLTAGNAHLNTLDVAGKATLESTQVKGQTKISGKLDACHTKFYQKITISSERTHLSGSYTGDIQINPGGEMQVLCLGNNSLVNGNIKFTSNRGVVAIDSNSKINGYIIGGYVSQKDFDTYCEGDEIC